MHDIYNNIDKFNGWRVKILIVQKYVKPQLSNKLKNDTTQQLANDPALEEEVSVTRVETRAKARTGVDCVKGSVTV